MRKGLFEKISIKRQLLTWVSFVLLLNTIVFFVSFYLLTIRYFDYETERSLLLHASQIAYSISATDTSNIHDPQINNILELSRSDMPGVFIEILDEKGVNSEGMVSTYQDLNAKSISENAPTYSRQSSPGSTMRLISFPIRSENSIIGTVIMGHPIDVYERTLDQLRNIGIFVLFFLTVPSILIGYYFTNISTNPISRLSKDINAITTENLSTKVDLQAGSQETATLIKNFNSLLDRLNKSFNLERQFLGEMAHEIKTPLAVIKSNSEVILSKKRSTEEYEEALKQNLLHIDKLTNRLLSLMDFAWSQNAGLEKNFTKVNLSLLLRELCDVANYMGISKNIKVSCSIQDNVFVSGKEEKLYQAFYNVIDNGIKYNNPKGTLDIRLTTNTTKVYIRVSDTGTGINPNQIKTIFDRFYRSEKNKNIAGHGLGLAISDSIVKAHKGTIEVEKSSEKGSTFLITLNKIS